MWEESAKTIVETGPYKWKCRIRKADGPSKFVSVNFFVNSIEMFLAAVCIAMRNWLRNTVEQLRTFRLCWRQTLGQICENFFYFWTILYFGDPIWWKDQRRNKQCERRTVVNVANCVGTLFVTVAGTKCGEEISKLQKLWGKKFWIPYKLWSYKLTWNLVELPKDRRPSPPCTTQMIYHQRKSMTKTGNYELVHTHGQHRT